MITLCYGMPGYGKTLWMHDYVSEHSHPEGCQCGRPHRFLILDHTGEWGPEAPHWRGKPPRGMHVYEARDKFPNSFDDYTVHVFRGFEPELITRLTLAIGESVYVDDEIDRSARKKGWDESSIKEIVHRGRHAENDEGEYTEVHLIGACRRPQNLHTDITDLADQICVFRVQGSRTLERLKNDSVIEDAEWDKIRTLPKFHFRHWPSGIYMQVKPIGKERPTTEAPPSDDSME